MQEYKSESAAPAAPAPAPSAELTEGQLAVLFLATSMGSAIIFIPGAVAGVAANGAWLSMASAWAFGTAMFGAVMLLHKLHQGADLMEICARLFGKLWGKLALLLYTSMMLFAVSAIITGFSDFFNRSMMPKTPTVVFSSLSMLMCIMTVRAGLTVLARMFVLLVPVMVISTAVVLVLAYPLYDWGRMLPLVEKGTAGWLQGFYITAGFPFGEIVFMSVLLSSAPRPANRKLYRRLAAAYHINGTMMVISTLCTIAAFGPAAGKLMYSLYQLAGNTVLSGISERIEAVVGTALVLGSYMKATVFLFILNRLVSALAGKKDEQAFVFPLGIVCTLLSVTLFDHPFDFRRQVYQLWPAAVILFGCTFLLLLLLITFIRGRRPQGGRAVHAARPQPLKEGSA